MIYIKRIWQGCAETFPRNLLTFGFQYLLASILGSWWISLFFSQLLVICIVELELVPSHEDFPLTMKHKLPRNLASEFQINSFNVFI